MAKIGFLFPGQGSQKVGMGRDLHDELPECRDVFEEADARLGFSLGRLCFEGPEEELKRTANTQPAILTVSVALARALDRRGVRPAAVAGHSLGEYSAVVAAGGLSFADAVQTVHHRGQYMQEAVPQGIGAMSAVLGLPAEQVAEVCRATAEANPDEVVSPANFNADTQVVIAGHAVAVERAGRALSDAGARRVVPLPVSAPFHCSLMLPAEERLAADLEGLAFAETLAVPLVTNVDAAWVERGADERDALRRQVSRPVRWTDGLKRMAEAGVDTVVEVGPGNVLTGLARSSGLFETTVSVRDRKSLDKAVDRLGAS